MTDVVRIDKPQKRRTVKKQNQTKEADTLFSLIVRAPGRCLILGCGKKTGLQCAHGFSRRYRPIRWDERNAFCLCAGHHHWFTMRPLEWDEWLRNRLGVELYQELRSKALAGGRTDFKATLARLRARKNEIYG